MNSTNKTIIIVLIILALISGIYLVSRTSKSTNTDRSIETVARNKDTAEGQVIFSVTDAAADMGNVSEINMKINKVEVHNSTSGWTTVSTTPQTFSLLSLNKREQSELLADIRMKPGTYDQVRFGIESVAVQTKTGMMKVATLPAKQFTANTTLVVTADTTSSINFDLLASKSLFTTTTNEYVFAPVVITESKSDTTISVDAKNVVSTNGGHVDSTSTSGMDLDGTIKLNFQIKSTQVINVNNNNTINADSILK